MSTEISHLANNSSQSEIQKIEQKIDFLLEKVEKIESRIDDRRDEKNIAEAKKNDCKCEKNNHQSEKNVRGCDENKKTVYTTDEAARYLGISKSSLFTLCRREQIKHKRVFTGRRSPLRFKREWLDEYLEGGPGFVDVFEPPAAFSANKF